MVISCNKDDDSGSGDGNSRKVKYELSGSYTGTLLIAYTNEDGVTQIADDVSLPWSKEVVVKGSGPVSIGLQAGSEVGGFGEANQNMTGKISVGGIVKKSGSVNSTNTGYIDLGIVTQL